MAGARVIVSSRREKPGRLLAREFDAEWISPKRLSRETYSILVNATPAGMDGRSCAVPRAAIKGELVVDLTYRTPLTPLLRWAAEAGLKVIDGLDILLAQGREQFSLFMGREAPADAMARALLEAVPPLARPRREFVRGC
jgi:shikimate dehydrogenase